MAVAKKKEAAAGGGAPAWMVTYGDMVTLLLTFFVLLLAMSEVEQDQKMLDFMQAVKEAFGYAGGDRHLPTEEVNVPKNVDRMTVLVLAIQPDNFGYTSDEGPQGKRERVTNIRPGNHYQPGGRFRFSELSAELSESEVVRLAEYARQLRGHTTLIEVRGHCSKRPLDGTPFLDHMDLSIQRARAVELVLIENGIDPQRIHVLGAGTTQPITRSSADADERQRNDVVELFQIDQTMDDFHPQAEQPALQSRPATSTP
jgi:chemotaxis protein MotB